MSALQAVSLFAGIGGFDLAAQRMGIDVVMQAEIDPSAQRVLRAHFDAPLTHDARVADLRDASLVMAGFPCQGLSAAASTPKGQGLLDPTSPSAVVWPFLERVVRARPPFLLLENADSLSSKRYAEDLGALLRELVGHGYFVHIVRLNSGCYGSVMRRVRTFILGRRSPWARPSVPQGLRWTSPARAIGVNNQQGGALFCAQPSVTKKAGSYTLMVTPNEVRTLTPEAVEILFGYPTGWTAAAGSNSERYARLGNTVSVHAATAALQLLLNGEAPVRLPTYQYIDLAPWTVPAGGGAAGSAFGRMCRTLVPRETGGRNPNTNTLELAYCAPVYERWMRAHADDVSDAMWCYLEKVKPHLPPAQPWPTDARVEMRQD